MIKRSAIPALFLACVLLLFSCAAPAQHTAATPEPAFSSAPMHPAPEIMLVRVKADPSYETFFRSDPSSQLSEEIREVWNPDPQLYNALYFAAQEHADSFGTSGYDLTERQIAAACESLYEQAGFQLYYLRRVKYDSEKKRVSFQYTDDSPDKIARNQNTFYRQMNHLLYNVAPEGNTPTQRFFSVYDYITRYANYTEDMNDPATTTVNGVLVLHAGICGSFSMLASYVLRFLQVPTEYVSNEAHAWNIVTLEGARFQTDFTWGAGWASGIPSNGTYLLMDDTRRIETLEQNGIAQYESIRGYPRQDPAAPLPCTDARYSALFHAYGPYALDLETGWIYFTDEAGIRRMKFDGTQAETVVSQSAYEIVFFNGILYFTDASSGILYFTDASSGILYRTPAGQAPEVLDDSAPVYQLSVADGILHYMDGTNAPKSIDLNPFQKNSIRDADMRDDASAAVPGTSTYAVEVSFSIPMDTTLPKDKIGLLTDAGQSLPLSLQWSEDATKLTIRSNSNLILNNDVTLYLAPGLYAQNGQATQSGVSKRIEASVSTPQ